MNIPREPATGDLPDSASEAFALGWRMAWVDATADERERCARLADPPLMHRKGRVGLWRKRRAQIAADIRAE